MNRSVFTRIVSGLAVLAVALSAHLLAGQDKPAESGKLAVSVDYTGKGTVDKDHHLWIWVFDNPDSSTWADTSPLAVGTLTEDGATYKFAALPKQVYLAAGYDEKGGYDGASGAPPQGTPVAVYGAEAGGPAAAVPTGGDDATLKFSFDDSFRMP